MSAADLQSLALPGIATFTDGPGGLVALDISSPLAKGRIYLHGAHVAEWTPAGADPVLFMSGSSLFAPNKAIRGGVPICFPWFGGREGHPESPAHGFARTTAWTVESLTQEADGTVVAVFALTDSEASRATWPASFIARQKVRVGKTLEMIFEVENRGSEAFRYEIALHTYFTVADARNVEIRGLENAPYVDKVDGMALKTQPNEPLKFTGETDRVFPGTTATCVLTDPGLKREIVVEKSGSASTVVWNPWIAKAKAMADFGDEEWPTMACIETANTAADSIELAPGATHATTARISIRPV